MIARTDPPAGIRDRYAERYTAAKTVIQVNLAEFEAVYTGVNRVTPEWLRGW
jgi:hypothetical protein